MIHFQNPKDWSKQNVRGIIKFFMNEQDLVITIGQSTSTSNPLNRSIATTPSSVTPATHGTNEAYKTFCFNQGLLRIGLTLWSSQIFKCDLRH